jgi:hypothetical protein
MALLSLLLLLLPSLLLLLLLSLLSLSLLLLLLFVFPTAAQMVCMPRESYFRQQSEKTARSW